jgi:predicted CXXCH cytochrome family protein
MAWARDALNVDSMLSPTQEAIDTDGLVMVDRDGLDEVAIGGQHLMGLNPAATVTIPGRSFTEIEFSVRPTVDAEYLAVYEFRITDNGAPIAEATVTSVGMGVEPKVDLSKMRNGIPVGGPAPEGVAYRLSPPDVPSGPVAATAVAAGATTATAPRYALAIAVSPSVAPARSYLAAALDSTHGPPSMTADACASCHDSHTALGSGLLRQPTPQSNICFTCHSTGGSASALNVQAQYADANVPANVPATRTYYRHDALAANSGHTLASENEFGGVSNRHNECSDCHNAHAADSTNSVQTTLGWTASGRLQQVPGVSVVNSLTPGAAPTYTFLAGGTSPITLEYQLCFKCHSGFTTLLANTGFTASRYVLDKGIEFNPNNASFHPIEAKGTNATTAMANSLAGVSTNKQWNFLTTSTIRCENCHGDNRKYNAVSPPLPGSDLAPHANQPGAVAAPVPGILMQTYKYRELKGRSDAYSAADFALCYMCHAEAPFKDTSKNNRTDTNFSLHGFHVNGIANKGPAGTNIDLPNNGGGRAICAECHFRIHSTTYRVAGQGAYQRLVNFSPNVTGAGSTTAPVGANAWNLTNKTCTLTCHSQDHSPKGY